MEKLEICTILKDIATLLELTGENLFKVRAYENAIHSLENTDKTIKELIETHELEELKGIGEAITKKITELATTDHLKYYDELKASIPPGLIEMLKLQGMGPKKINHLYTELNITTLDELEKACLENKILELKGFGQITQDHILKSIDFIKSHKNQYRISTAMESAKDIIKYLKQAHDDIIRLELGGSLRRFRETVKDIDLLASSRNPDKTMELFISYPHTASIIGHGHTKTSITLDNGINVDLRVVSDKEFPYAWHHFTGSKAHNIHMRALAKEKNIKMNEYGLWKNDKIIPCKDEKNIFKAIGLNYIPPEAREDMGEIEFAMKNKFPKLIEKKDIKGAIHVHTTWSDGKNNLEEMALAARDLGYSYIGIAEHSASAIYANGLSIDRVKEQKKEIDKLNKKIKGIYILQGIEVEILNDGSIDYPPNILESFDFTIAAVHNNFNMDIKEMTSRLISALKNKYVNILAHPTGRLLLEREAYPVDMNEVIQAASDYGKIIELNCNPKRLDIDWRHLKQAKEKNVLISIDTDAHNIESLGFIEYGIGIARKGWLCKEDVANTRSVDKFLKNS